MHVCNAMGKTTIQPECTPAKIELKIASDPANLRHVRKQLEDFALSAGLTREECDDLGLAINEALANVIRHGYGGATDQPILVTAQRRPGEVCLSIRDWTKPFNPAALPEVAAVIPSVDTIRPGGLGLLCIRRTMDEVTYEPLPDGMLLTLVKRSG